MKKLLIIGPEPFFVLADCPNSLKTEIPYHQKPPNAGLGIYSGVMKQDGGHTKNPQLNTLTCSAHAERV